MKKRDYIRGQTMTEFLFILIILIAVIMLHVQFSLNYVIASYMKYATFMTARAASVGGNYEGYRENMVGTSTASKLSVVAKILPPTGGNYLQQKNVTIPYELFQWIPFIEKTGLNLMFQKAVSPFQNQSMVPPPTAYFDNEGGNTP